MLYDKTITKTLICDLGLLLHLPAILSAPVFVVSIIYKEWTALQAFAIMGSASLCLGQILYRSFKGFEKSTSASSIILVALVWLLIPLIGAFPFWYIASMMENPSSTVEVFQQPVNAIFEAISGFTSTGLTMARNPSELTYTLQWWRSLSEWIGGSGIIVLSLFLLNTHHKSTSLYEVETRSWIYHDELSYTVRTVLMIYLIFTFLSVAIFYISGMPIWEAINHGLTAISTGGFSVKNNSFTNYSQTIKIAAMAIMMIGAFSFKIHFLLFRLGKWRDVARQTQLRYFITIYIVGLAVAFLIAKQQDNIEVLFQWTSALATCGFSTTNLSTWSSPVLLLLIVAMCMGGNTDSTTGGLKTERVAWLLKQLFWFVGKSWKEESQLTVSFNGEKVSQEDIPEKIHKVTIIFFLWVLTLFAGTLLLSIVVEGKHSFQNIIFEAASALNSVGLSTGIATPDLHWAGKTILILLMWMGRLEIFAVLFLVCSPFLLLSRKK